MPGLVAKVAVVVLASFFEGHGVSVLEAMAAGKAVIASRVGGLPELVIDAATGFLVEPRDVAGLASALAKLASDRTLIRSMGQKGRERLEKNFTMEEMALQNEDHYYDLLQSAGNSPISETSSTSA